AGSWAAAASSARSRRWRRHGATGAFRRRSKSSMATRGRWRRQEQPRGMPSCGSTGDRFQSPKGCETLGRGTASAYAGLGGSVLNGSTNSSAGIPLDFDGNKSSRQSQRRRLEEAMNCLYYLAPTLDSTHRISDDLHAAGMKDFFLHVVSKGESGLEQEHIHSSNYLETLDVLRDGFIGAAIGALFGLLGAGLLMYFQPF